MKPAPFELHRPTTVEEAAGLLAEFGDDAKVLAGGQSLVPLLALRLARFPHLVDLNAITELQGIERDDRWLTVRSMTRQSAAERDGALAAAVPLLHRALPHIGHFQIRNRGTVGGSTAHADPASELPAVALALDAELVATGRNGSRTIPASHFFQGMWTTALEPDEVLASIRYPVWQGRCGFAIEEFARREGDFAIAGVACGVEMADDGSVARAAVALFGMGQTPVRAEAAGLALVGEAANRVDRRAIAALAIEATEPTDDLHGSAAFRRRIGAHLVEQALGYAIKEASVA